MNINASVTVPQEILLTLRENEDEFILELKKTAAVRYFKEKKLSIGQCALLSEMSEENFIKYLSKQGVSIFSFEDDDEILEDIKNA